MLARRSDHAGVVRVRDALRLAGIARRLSRARLGRIGRPLEGYQHVDADDADLRAATGIELVPIDADEVVEHYRAVADDRVRGLEAEVRRDWTFEEPLDGSDSSSGR